MRKIGLIKPAFLVLICGSIATAVTGCSSPVSSLASSSAGCVYKEDFGAERHETGLVFRCVPEPRSLN
jgi:hypothetical protein